MYSLSVETSNNRLDVMQQITLTHGTVYYRQAGRGSPVLLLHGWGGSSRYWQTTIQHLSASHQVYAPDLPGYGASPPLADRASNERLAALVIEFADALGIESFDLNGHSFAASIAVYVAAGWPDRVKRLMLTCASTYRNERERRVVQMVHHVMAGWLRLRQPWMAHQRWIYRSVAQRFFYRVPADDELLRENFVDFLRMDRRVAIEGAQSAGSPAYNTALQRVGTPTLVIGARQDMIMPTSGTPFVAALIPDSRLIWIDHCGHLPMIEQPEEYNRVVCEFLNGAQIHTDEC